jgi:hypothetical protein
VGIYIFAWELDLSNPSQHILEDPDFDMLLSLCADQLSLLNDMYSYRREALWMERQMQNRQQMNVPSKNGDLQEVYILNAVVILLREDGVDETNVMERLGTHIRRKESEFISTVEKLGVRFKDHPKDLDLIKNWVAMLTDLMAGNYYWSTICGRYNKLEIANE